MISGEYQIKKNKMDDFTHTECTLEIELCVVTYEQCEYTASKFLDELQALLDKYSV